MSRLATLSPAALAELFKPDAQKYLITLLTVYGEDDVTPVFRLADNWTQRLSDSANDPDIIYGVKSTLGGTTSHDYYYLPMQVVMPSEELASAPRASLVFSDVTKYLLPVVRQLTMPPRIRLDIVLNTTPNVVEISFDKFYLSNITYTADQITADLTMVDYAIEPFPKYSFTPAYFPGLF